MALNNYVEQILNSPIYVFDEIIDKLISRNVHQAKIELSRHSIYMDEILLESISSILKDLEEEEGIFSRFLYSTFGFEIRKNKRREQLLYLGSELKTQHHKIKIKLTTLYRQKERLGYTIIDLERLKEGFIPVYELQKNIQIRNKSKFFIDEISEHILDLKKYQIELLLRHNSLKENELIYNRLFKKIPRYQELEEEIPLLLSPSKS